MSALQRRLSVSEHLGSLMTALSQTCLCESFQTYLSFDSTVQVSKYLDQDFKSLPPEGSLLLSCDDTSMLTSLKSPLGNA